MGEYDGTDKTYCGHDAHPILRCGRQPQLKDTNELMKVEPFNKDNLNVLDIQQLACFFSFHHKGRYPCLIALSTLVSFCHATAINRLNLLMATKRAFTEEEL